MLVKDFIQQNRGRGSEDALAVLLFGLRLVEYSDKEFGGIIDIVAGYIHESGVSHGRRKKNVLGIAMAFLFKFPVSSKAKTPFRFDSTDGSTDSDTAPRPHVPSPTQPYTTHIDTHIEIMDFILGFLPSLPSATSCKSHLCPRCATVMHTVRRSILSMLRPRASTTIVRRCNLWN